MTSRNEKPFNGVATVSALKEFLLEKKRKITMDINANVISFKNIEKAKSFVRLIEMMLATEYFNSNNSKYKVYELMQVLKDRDQVFERKIKELSSKIKTMEYNLDHSEEFNVPEGYVIPDEKDSYIMSIEPRRREYLWKIEAVRDELKAYEYKLKVCRNLKGIISRPNGFFSSVYKK